MPETVLVVEDDPSILRGLQMNLGLEGFKTICAHDGEEGLAMMRSHKPDVVLLDLMLPKLGGLEVIKRLRADDPDTPIIVLSAKDEEADKVLALSLGADDYVTKPFSVAELRSRARAVLRRSELAPKSEDEGERLVSDDVVLDLARRTCDVRGVRMELTYVEFEILAALMRSPGRVLSRRALLEAVWESADYREQRTIDVHVRHLREKLEADPSEPLLIQTVRGVGYRFRG
jgi:DNA-binding response OmpR family regulator